MAGLFDTVNKEYGDEITDVQKSFAGAYDPKTGQTSYAKLGSGLGSVGGGPLGGLIGGAGGFLLDFWGSTEADARKLEAEQEQQRYIRQQQEMYNQMMRKQEKRDAQVFDRKMEMSDLSLIATQRQMADAAKATAMKLADKRRLRAGAAVAPNGITSVGGVRPQAGLF